MEYKTSKQPTNQPKQTRKLATKHFYFMAFDNIGGT